MKAAVALTLLLTLGVGAITVEGRLVVGEPDPERDRSP